MTYFSDKRRGRHFHASLECPLTGPHYQVTSIEEIKHRQLTPHTCVLKELSWKQIKAINKLRIHDRNGEYAVIFGSKA